MLPSSCLEPTKGPQGETTVSQVSPFYPVQFEDAFGDINVGLTNGNGMFCLVPNVFLKRRNL